MNTSLPEHTYNYTHIHTHVEYITRLCETGGSFCGHYVLPSNHIFGQYQSFVPSWDY